MRPPLYYRLAIALAKPLYRLVLSRKKDTLPHYEREIAERFGQRYAPLPPTAKGIIWCHAVSLGELNTAYPLLKLLLNQGFCLWITSTTQTGFARVSVLFADELGVSVEHSFVPVDDERVVGRFLAHVKPRLALFVETELWANTLYLLKKQGIASAMVNARLTERSFLRYQKFAKLSQSMMANLSLIVAQDRQSFEHFVALGADIDKVKLAYSLKWSGQLATPNETLLGQIDTWHTKRPIWLMASTHAGEEGLALDVHKKLLSQFANALLILVPRHPERFDEVFALCQNFKTQRRSQGEGILADTQIFLADSMGELLAWYQTCDVAVVGGSFVDKGGHNPIEPAYLAKPIIMGQHTKNCTELVADLAGVGALVQTDADGLFGAVKAWLDNPIDAQRAGEQGQWLVKERAGAGRQQFEFLAGLGLLGE